MLAVVCAVLSSGLYAAASVLQQRTASAESQEHALRLGLLTRLLRNPLWIIGVAADIAGFVLQFIALGNGAIAVVQPLLVCGLLFALPLGAWLSGERFHRQDWIGAVGVCAGLAVFLIVARPAAGRQDVYLHKWVIMLVSAAVACALLLALCKGRTLRQRAVLLSAVTGISYGVAAALAKTAAHQLSRSIPFLFTHWQVYVLVGIGIGGMVVSQSAFQAGSLDASLPTMTVIDPLVSILIGAFVFRESLDVGAGVTTLEVVSLAVMVVGVFLLARTKAVQSLHEVEPDPVT